MRKDSSLIIEQLRLQLNNLVKEKGLADSSVIALSQELDKYIVEYQLIIHNGRNFD